MFGLGMQELVIVGILAILLFGKRLPEVARSLGKTYSGFKRQLTDFQREMNSAMDAYDQPTTSTGSGRRKPSYDDFDDRDEATAPKFEPPPAEPKEA